MLETTIRTPKLFGLLAATAFVIAACDDDSILNEGINSLGADFVRAFNKDPNDEPFDAQDINLTMTPEIEPFNP